MMKILGIVAVVVLLTACVNSDSVIMSASKTIQRPSISHVQKFKRVALVIGNNDYEDGHLTNAVGDAQAMRSFLNGKDFQKIVYAENANEIVMRARVKEFLDSLDTNSLGFVYFSGHGIQEYSQKYRKTVNYLIPIDNSKLGSVTDLDYYTVSLNYILDSLSEKNSGFNIVLLDACRTPFKAFSKSTQDGLAQSSAKGVYIAYATADGQKAWDNGLFRRLFIKYAEQPMKLIEIFEQVKVDVYSQTSQMPYTDNKKIGSFYFTEPVIVPPVEPTVKIVEKIVEKVIYVERPTSTTISNVEPVKKAESKLSYEPQMVHISRGSYTMGSNNGYSDEKPIHQVNIGYDFEIGKYEVTIKEYKACVDDGGCKQPKWLEKGNEYNIYTGTKDQYKKMCLKDNCPAIGVSWHNAKAYTKWLSQKTGKNYRLPTEAEWEFVARAGTETKWSFGDKKSSLKDYAWYIENSNSKTHQVGTKEANQWGVYDMHGNVYEWCEDCYLDSYNSTPIDGSANQSQNKDIKVLRGGSWFNFASLTRSANRLWDAPTDRYGSVGFRLQRTLP